ncbi:hypothetical protein CVIRNUC_002613 [Coccomyxa viridis]|uniref:Pescadillo homolog n=1 Tax=Coccomyxa viridis TaxID=1274662 RepID=A0AAV1HXX2_9CHLO|nr:hypothetical protein CVIRNUC_002613 [Coccomyxa viridis]
MGQRKKRGQAGNAVQYITRNQALKKLQLRLSEFRRLCILKGVHPREPKKKTQGQNKTYYHIKDINFLAHEPLLNKLRDAHAFERKIKRANAKKNRDLAERLQAMRPSYRLDHLVKERYPSFVDAVRDLDDPLTMVHLFATLPAEKLHGIPASVVQTSRRLALEWQAWVVRTAALRRTFVSVKGFYFQAEVVGQPVTWLVPHALSQVLPTDVDYRVMLTFLEFYQTLLQFVNFKLYNTLGVRYPPVVDPKLDEAAAGLASIMQDLAQGRASQQKLIDAAAAAATRPEHTAAAEQRQESLPAKLTGMRGNAENGTQDPDSTGAADAGAQQAAGAKSEMEADEEAGDSEDEELGSISSGEESDGDEEDAASEDDEEDADVDEHSEAAVAAGARGVAAAAGLSSHEVAGAQTQEEHAGVGLPAAEGPAEASPAAAAGGAAAADEDDEASLCGALLRGFVFFLGREVPREALLLIIRSFGGTVGWDGDGSPIREYDESISHQVVDRPTQGHKYLSRTYVQPQWVLDSANFRVLADAELYAPGKHPPPHLSPFVTYDDEGYVPDYAKAMLKLQEAANAARKRAAGMLEASTFMEIEASREAIEAVSADEAAVRAEQLYTAELREELAGRAGMDSAKHPEEALEQSTKGARKRAAAEVAEEGPTEDDMAATMLPRKQRNLYASIQKQNKAKRARAQDLEQRRAALAED